jgi:cytochrome c biogenesis protein CcdA/thiol-disulfide isomerase/thioredoxin
MLLLIVVAITAGLATAVSPCVLPILPIVLATGADGDRRRPFLVIAGLIASFSVFTLVSVQIVDALHLPSASLRDAAIVIIALFGLTLLVPALGTRFERLTSRLTGLGARMTEAGRDEPAPLGRAGYSFDGQPHRRSGPAGIVGSLVTGVGLGLVWTPCAGPILGAITSLAVTAPGSLATVALVIAYAIGAGLPLLAIAIGGRMALARLRMRSVSAWASRAFGVLVLATAGLMAGGYDTALSADLTNALPNWTGTLQTIERAQPVQAQLHDIGVAGAGSGISGPASGLSGLPVGPAAPDFTGVDAWLNSSPLTMADLKGKVVLIDFWTYSCINCIRTLPYVEGWYQKYAADGFVVVGVHTPEFAFEHDKSNVQAAIARFGITYPVAQDNEYGTWQAFSNQYWPADYLIDATGHIRSEHFGEGDYNTTEDEIRGLLAEAGQATASLPSAAPEASAPPFVDNETPETYIGTDRAGSFASPEQAQAGAHQYSFPPSLTDDWFAVSGTFDFQPEYATETVQGAQLELSFYARDVYLVASADSPVSATVKVTGASGATTTEDVSADGSMQIGTPRLYHLVHLPAAARGIVTITFNGTGARAYSFTFGG